MIYNVLIGGAAGQGMETLATILEKLLKKKGFEIFTLQDYMSRVRGGHNFFQIRFGDEEISSHWNELDGIIALNKETIELHIDELKDTGFIIADEEIEYKDDRFNNLPLKALAKTLGNPKVFGNVALGALLKLFNLDLCFVEDLLKETFNTEVAVQNLAAFEAGYKEVSPKYDIKAKKKDKRILIDGNDAIALGALAAGCKFYSAYPMTPSTTIMNYLASKIQEAEIVVEQAEDEIAAINMAIGASFAGVRAMTGTSGGGYALMVEAVGLSSMLEVPLVIAEIQRPGPTTGFPTRTEQADLKFVISGTPGEVPKMVIALRNPEDCFYQTMRAFNLADKYQIPVILLGDQFLADSLRTIKSFDFKRIIELGKKPHEVLIVGGIGQAAKTAQYINTNGFCGLHGRSLPPAIAAKIVNKEMMVIVDTGEGDAYGEGGNHFIHNVRRNIDITHFVHNNQIYGLTKGQASPTTDMGHVTSAQPFGSNNIPMNPVLLAITLGAGFVARAFSNDKETLKDIMLQAINHKGYALVDILQPCVSFNKINTHQWYKNRIYMLDKSYDPANKLKAMEKAMEWGDNIPVGVLYREVKPHFTDKLDFLKNGKPLVNCEINIDKISGFMKDFQ